MARSKWALILGASSGFGAANCRELAKHGFNILGVHLDRKSTLELVEKVLADIRSHNVQAVFYNTNAAGEEERKRVLDDIENRFKSAEGSQIDVMLHSLAFGTLKPYITDNPKEAITKAQMDMTVDVMAHSLVYWVQDLAARKLIGKGTHIFAMTSAGGSRVWKTYGAVSAAKAALESHIRQLSLELAPMGATCNAILAGVTDTPALRKIPGNEYMLDAASKRNPFKRLTTPEDVARAIATFSNSGTEWMTGNVIRVDGGENIVD